ncbi:UNVERIFIED_CONTAM: hypothetical protein Slati_2969100 [Sesamum latifolium]|uniref:Endonuclease/exonuclease/phosphatase n=1 Tax=Sesamum latifolium TaxID=2727402 RepID=A0AAW2VFC1_9LAMI
MGFEGEEFMWSNHREHPHTVRARLDRACCTTDWMEIYPEAQVKNMAIGGSDHCILDISLEPEENRGLTRRSKCFRFEAAWLREPSCEEAIRTGWKLTESQKDAMTIHNRIQHVRIQLLQWERLEFGNI